MDAREIALLTLNTCQRQGEWADHVLKKQLAAARLDSRDAALATQLCFGVLQNQMLLDFYLGQCSNLPLKRMESKVIIILRLGLYQMLFLDKIPNSAAVDSAVTLTRRYSKNRRASGLVNAILRNIGRNLEHLPEIPQGDPAEYLSIRYSHPKWLVQACLSEFGAEQTAAFLRENNGTPPMTAIVNSLRCSREQLVAQLDACGVTAVGHPWLSDCVILSGTGNLEQLAPFSRGLFYIQDPASRLAVLAGDLRPGMRILDACAAPGGKSFAAAIDMKGKGEIISCDLSAQKVKRIEQGRQRLGLDCIRPVSADAKEFQPQWEAQFDVVLVDAPCSGLGVIRKKPDIRYKNPELLQGLPAIQREILDNVCRYVRPGGILLYSTCTILRQENQQMVDYILKRHPDYRAEAFSLPGPVGEVAEGCITLWPQVHGTDGFFFAKLRCKDTDSSGGNHD